MVYLHKGILLSNKNYDHNDLLIHATAGCLHGYTFLKLLSAFEGISVKERERDKGYLALIIGSFFFPTPKYLYEIVWLINMIYMCLVILYITVCICQSQTPNSSLSPPPVHFGNSKFVFKVCEYVSVLQ